MMSLNRKVAIVTGASRGIGLAVVKKLAAVGVLTYGIARNKPEQAQQPEEIKFLRADVGDRDQVEKVVHEVLQQSGRIDILVNNAGVELVKPLAEISDPEYDLTMNTNLKGSFIFTTAVLPAMIKQKAGHLIFVNSVSGIRGFTEGAVYSASKYGLTGLVDALNEELRSKGIRVSGIHPGATDTELALNTWSPADDPRRPFFLKPEDVADAVVYVASQPTRVVIKQMIIQPMIEPPYSDFLPVELMQALIKES